MFCAPSKENLSTILLALLFCGTPLIFSHLCVLFGVNFHPFPSGYERYKVYSIIILVLALIPLLCGGKKVKSMIPVSKYIPLVLTGLGFGIIWFGVEQHTWREIFLGSGEKQHGLFFFIALIILFFILQKTKDVGKYIVGWSIFGGILLSFYALLQYAGLDPLMGGYYHDGWSTKRVFATLGNPNYLAGYLLLLLPMLGAVTRLRRTILCGVFGVVVFLTGSVFGIALMLLYLLWEVTYRWKMGHRIFIVLAMSTSIILVSYLFLPPEKTYSFLARLALWREGFSILLHNPIILLFGNGPDTIISYLQNHSIAQGGAYFSPGSVIDSFHNVFLDSIFYFGLPANLLFYAMVARRWRYLNSESREGILLFVLFFSMNIVISVHFLLLVFYIASQKQESGKEVHEKDTRIFDN